MHEANVISLATRACISLYLFVKLIQSKPS
jgi:hypothetical protein